MQKENGWHDSQLVALFTHELLHDTFCHPEWFPALLLWEVHCALPLVVVNAGLIPIQDWEIAPRTSDVQCISDHGLPQLRDDLISMLTLHNSTNLASYAPASEVRLDVEVLHVDLPPFPRGVGEVIQWESHELNNRFENISITKYNIFALFNVPSDLIPQQSTGKMSRRQIHLSQGFLLKFLVRQASSHSPPTLE